MFSRLKKDSASFDEQVKACANERKQMTGPLENLSINLGKGRFYFQNFFPSDFSPSNSAELDTMLSNTRLAKALLELGNKVTVDQNADDLTKIGKAIFQQSDSLMGHLFGDLREINRSRSMTGVTYKIYMIRREVKALADALECVVKVLEAPNNEDSFKQLNKNVQKLENTFVGATPVKNLVRLLGVFVLLAGVALIVAGVLTGGVGALIAVGIAITLCSFLPPVTAAAIFDDSPPRRREAFQRVFKSLETLTDNRQSFFAKPVNDDSPSLSQPVQSLNNNRG